MHMKDQKLLQKIGYERNISPGTIHNYKKVIQHYTKYTGKPFHQLIHEAQTEERERIPWIDRKLKDYLINFRAWLYNTYNENTAQKYFSTLLTIHRHFYIEIHYLPPISNKNTIKSDPYTYEDLPTKEIIKASLRMHNTTGPMKPLILGFSSGGASLIDMLTLEVVDYIKGLKKYIQQEVEINNLTNNDIYQVIKIIQEQQKQNKIIIPIIYLRRKKTKQPHFILWSPETVNATNQYLLTRKDLKLNDKLFPIHPRYLSEKFLKINNELGLGKKNKYAKFTSRMLRKFHATSLESNMGKDKVDFLQGRKGITTTQQSYYFNNPQELMELYIQNLDKLMINWEVETLTYESPEVLELRKENERLEKESQRLELLEEKVNKLLNVDNNFPFEKF